MCVCFECGQPATVKHHVIPQSLGGKMTVDLCCECHNKVHDADISTSGLTRIALAKKKAKLERTGTVPFGYDLADDGVSLVVNHMEQLVINDMRRLRTGGKSFRSIAEWLTRMNVRTKQGKTDWQHTSVRRIVERVPIA